MSVELAVAVQMLGVPGVIARLPPTIATTLRAELASAAALDAATRAHGLAAAVARMRGPIDVVEAALHPARLTALLAGAPDDVRRAWRLDPTLAPAARTWGKRWLVATVPDLATLAPPSHAEIRQPHDVLTWSPPRLASLLGELGTALLLVATDGAAAPVARLTAAARLARLATSAPLRTALGPPRPLAALVTLVAPVDDDGARRLGIAAIAPHVPAALRLRCSPADDVAWVVGDAAPLPWPGVAALLRALATVGGVSSSP